MDDLISRQAVIDAVKEVTEWYYKVFHETRPDSLGVIERLMGLPSTVVRCDKCKHWLPIVENPKHGACDQWCTLNVTRAHDYCSRAERRTDE